MLLVFEYSLAQETYAVEMGTLSYTNLIQLTRNSYHQIFNSVSSFEKFKFRAANLWSSDQSVMVFRGKISRCPKM